MTTGACRTRLRIPISGDCVVPAHLRQMFVQQSFSRETDEIHARIPCWPSFVGRYGLDWLVRIFDPASMK